MKKLILFLIAFVCLIVTTEAQTARAASFSPTSYILEYTGLAADSSIVGSPWVKEITLSKDDGVFYNGKIKVIDQVAGAKGTIVLSGKIFDVDDYTVITTHTWTGAGTDTTVLFTSVTNKIYYRYLKATITTTTGEMKLSYLKLSLKK